MTSRIPGSLRLITDPDHWYRFVVHEVPLAGAPFELSLPLTDDDQGRVICTDSQGLPHIDSYVGGPSNRFVLWPEAITRLCRDWYSVRGDWWKAADEENATRFYFESWLTAMLAPLHPRSSRRVVLRRIDNPVESEYICLTVLPNITAKLRTGTYGAYAPMATLRSLSKLTRNAIPVQRGNSDS